MKVSVKSESVEAKSGGWMVVVACGVAGLVTAISFPGYNQWYLGWFSLVPLLLVLGSSSPGQGFRRAYVAGLVYYGFVLSWLFSTVYWAGTIALLGVFLLMAVLAIYWAVFGWAYCRLRLFGKWYPVVLGPLVWVVLEWLQSRLFSGFGWGLIGYSQIGDLVVSQCAAFGGVFLVSGIVVAVNVCLASVIGMRKSARWISLAAAVALFVLPHVAGFVRLRMDNGSTERLHVAVVQGGFPIEVMYNRELEEYIMSVQTTHSERMADRGARLIVWPESAVAGDFTEPDYGYGKETAELADRLDVYLLAGGIRRQEGDEKIDIFNSAFLFTPDGKLSATYDKVHLTPFGEYIPFKKFLPFLGKIVLSIFDITEGEELRVFAVDDVKCGPLVCFETVFPELSRGLVDRGAQCLVGITNLSWFGMSAAPQQEFALSRFRAIENGVPLIRSSVTGISGVVDSKGRLVDSSGMPIDSKDDIPSISAQSARTSIDVQVRLPSPNSRKTFYTRHGDLFILLSAVVLVVAIPLLARRKG